MAGPCERGAAERPIRPSDNRTPSERGAWAESEKRSGNRGQSSRTLSGCSSIHRAVLRLRDFFFLKALDGGEVHKAYWGGLAVFPKDHFDLPEEKKPWGEVG